jgi:acetyl-CoA carboxylase biotin carboxyl carrier protein
MPPAPVTGALPSALDARDTTNLITVESPMVGTFYRAPAPGADSYVREGEKVEKGTVLCIIEAMKLMNEIEAEVSGVVHSILAENAQPVEYGQPLFLLEPA